VVSEIYIDTEQVISRVEVRVMLMGSALQPVCPAMIEAAAIVEAEWMRLRPPVAPVGDVACELPAPRPHRDAPLSVVTTRPWPHDRASRRAELGLRWPVWTVWARERSPPERG
jgi:hypothetical protein